MFFIMGIMDGIKKLNIDSDVTVCKCCGRYGRAEVYMIYTYLSLFFIPVFKWNKRYYVEMSCCNSRAYITKEEYEKIKGGMSIDLMNLNFDCNNSRKNYEKICPVCGYRTAEDFTYCPKCGNRF